MKKNTEKYQKKAKNYQKRPKNNTFKPLSTIFVQCMKIQGGTDPLPPASDAYALHHINFGWFRIFLIPFGC